MLSGCGGPQFPIGGTMPQTRAVVANADRGESWALSEAKRQDLLYVTVYYSDVRIYNYPQVQLVGELHGLSEPRGLCSDKAGNVWITDPGAKKILEYAHGDSKPIASVNNNEPFTCAVDNSTGDLAVPNNAQYRDNHSYVVIFKNGRGKAKIYKIRAFELLSCGYDNAGNLFVNGFDAASRLVFAELPRGGQKFTEILIPPGVDAVGPIQWDGQYLAVQGHVGTFTYGIYRLQIKENKAKVVGIVHLVDGDVAAYWIGKGRVVGAVPTMTSIDFWKYPAGRKPLKSITNIIQPSALTVSVATR
jgi:hypothetical protein